jgi:tRNA A37 methylthiotransferase MiaB
VLAEARRLAGAGFAEIQLSGINLRHYGRGLEEPTDFWDLLAAVEKELTSAPGPAPRIRLSSLDPGQLGNKALETLGASKLVCPHLHLSLQSMSDKVLRNMNRGHYTAESVFGFLDRLAGQWPVFGLGCDMMAGFPGESREDFRMSLEALDRLPLSYAHVFPFSPRPGTAAAELPGRPPADEAGSRAAELRRAASRKRMQFLRRLGRLEILRLVLEDPESGEGVCEYYARCRYGHPPPQAAPGGLVAVRPTGIEKDVLLVEDLEETTEVDVS